ncbi:hypothetical protein NMY22_g18937 [Coprinellus aureogranulatus]|nr:hypothetical protein NMY22_g18937 [Coprinellus aureogranulatus]
MRVVPCPTYTVPKGLAGSLVLSRYFGRGLHISVKTTPLSPTTSKKVLSGAEISPPRLRRPSMAKQDDVPISRDKERVERDRDWNRERERERAERERELRAGGGRYERPSERLQPPAPNMARTNSLLARLGGPPPGSSNFAGNGAPSLFERVSGTAGTVTPMKRAQDDIEDDLYAPVDEPDSAVKRRRKGGGRARRSGGKRN